MNGFYQLNIGIQWFIASIMFFLMMYIEYQLMINISKQIYGFLLFFAIVPVAQFLASPFFTLIGMYKYLSPMLLVYSPNAKKYDIHNGTTFDYIFVMKGVKPGIEWRNKILTYYLEGLLKIVEEVENGSLDEKLEIKGSSYFFSDRTATRLGFEIKKAGIMEKFNLLLNYLDLIWMFSLSNGKLKFPNLMKIKNASISAKNLVKKKEDLIRIKGYIDKK